MKWRFSILAVLVGVCSLAAMGEPESGGAQKQAEFMVKSWSMADGLPHLSVTALAQTRDGYLWVGTLAGLARFDGVRFKVFTPQNCPQLPRSRIGALFTGADNTLFIATERGGGLVALRNGRFEQLLGSGNEQDEVVACLPDSGGDSLFIARSGALWRWNQEGLATLSTNRAFYPISPADVCLDRRGCLWMLSRVDEPGRLIRFSSGSVEPVALRGRLGTAQLHALARDTSGRIWLGTSKGLALLRGDEFEPVELPETAAELNVTGLAAAHDGSLWVCSSGYWQRKYKDGHWMGTASQINDVQTSLELLGEDRRGDLCLGRYPEGLVTVTPDGKVGRLDARSGLPGATVSCYLADREGNEWLGLFDGGLVRLQPRRFGLLGAETLTTPVYSICEDHQSNIWVGSSFGGVYRFSGTNVTRFGARDLPLTDVWSLFEDTRSNLWVGTSSHGVYQFRDGHFVPLFDRTQISDRVDAIYEDRTGRIWFGHWSGLACYADGRLTRIPMPWFSDEYEVVAIVADRQERLWLGTKGAGLFCFQNGQFTRYTTSNGLLSNLAWSLFVDDQDSLWIGTADGGLSRLRDGKFTHVTTRDGLADETVCHIAEDARHRLWFSSPHGVFSAGKPGLEAFWKGEASSVSCARYDQADGMPSTACTCAFQPSGCMTRDGRLLFPTLKGVVVVRPEAVEANSLPPPVLIEEVNVDGSVQAVRGPMELRTPPGEARVEIRYTALSFSGPEKVRFKYRMVGLQPAWQDGGAKRVVDYPYLPHGRYQFQVQACNDNGVWSIEPARVELLVPPHFWQTWWFIAAAVLVSGAATALTARGIEKVKARRKLEREQQAHLVELERARIARDFHDDIGACLSHLLVLSELIKGDKAKPAEVESYAGMMSSTARNAVRQLGTIIWAANPRNDTLDSLVQYISQYSYDFFQATPVWCRLDLPAEVPPVPLTAEVRHNLFMIVKEALHNILKHAQASEARLSLKLHNGTLELRVEDNGRGFDAQAIAGNGRSGLDNMRHRMQAIGAVLEINGRPGVGTSIYARLQYRTATSQELNP